MTNNSTSQVIVSSLLSNASFVREYRMKGEPSELIPDALYWELFHGSQIVKIDQRIFDFFHKRFAPRVLFTLSDRFGLELERGAKGIRWAEFYSENGEFFLRPPSMKWLD